MKYSCCYWPPGVNSIDQADDAMFQLTCERAQLEDGMDILDLGCGWGSLSHREFAYEFDASNPGNWMAQSFFAGGLLPSDDLLLHYN